MTNLIAHRGYSAMAPENTLASFQAALKQPIVGVEFDVHLSADGIPVVIHDASVDRTTNGQGKVAEKTLAQLQALDAGSWFDSRFAKEPIPTLEEVLALFSETPVQLYIELKSPQNWSSPRVRALMKQLDQWRDSPSETLRERCIIASFDHQFIATVREQFPQFRTGYGIADPKQYSQGYLATLNLTNAVLLPHFSLILKSPVLTETLLSQNQEIVTWTVDERPIADKLADLNLSKMISNNLLQTEVKPHSQTLTSD
ncbi:MAG: glycerophosphodiester phosphodiesterase [Cyanobacteria bacterium]|jgi:glycerophosphoryl diester phosphodiesterase|nr:glycerophosphodiester phosphodiesterase [Cyanobacteria bacterium GSL.Bin1]